MMANNRLYMRCKHCGKLLYLSKNFCSPYVVDEQTIENMNDFFKEHFYCPSSMPHSDGGDFELIDEWNADIEYDEVTHTLYGRKTIPRETETMIVNGEKSREVTKQGNKVCNEKYVFKQVVNEATEALKAELTLVFNTAQTYGKSSAIEPLAREQKYVTVATIHGKEKTE